METSLLGKFVAFDSLFEPNPPTVLRGLYYGEIVGVVLVEPVKYPFVIGHNHLTNRVLLLVRLGTFSKDSVVEIPLHTVRVFDTFEKVKEYCTPE